ncbi:MAG: tripartite tricarboxylate transporter permease [Acuticoccus sp.]
MVALDAAARLLDPTTLLVMLACAVYGLAVGAIPGFTATMAVALLVPVTYFLDPVPALAGVVTLAAMAIFAGDIPGALLRIPGTPASAAYADEAHKMTLRGEAATALGTGLVASALGGVFGALLLIFAAPALARIALGFSSFEYFWLACLGLVAAIVASDGRPAKSAISLFIGLAIASVGLDPVSGQQRFTFGSSDMVGGLGFIPVLIGLFAISEALRFALKPRGRPDAAAPVAVGRLFAGIFAIIARLKWSIGRGAGIGAVIGAIPGAGADIAAYVSYAVAKRLSPRRAEFGKGTVDAIAPATAANNAAVGGAFIPATVFGIPGDSLTAVVIGVLYMKGLNPGPTVFLMQAELLYAVFIAFLLANILIVPLGFIAIAFFQKILSAPPGVVMSLVVMACIVGAFAVENTVFAVLVMLGAGVLGFFMEENGFPLAPAILAVVLGPILEETFLTSLIKANGDLAAFFARPLAGTLGTITIAIIVIPALWRLLRKGAR